MEDRCCPSPGPRVVTTIELLPADLDAAKTMLDILNLAGGVENVIDVKITFRLDGGDWVTVGYGPMAEPAVIAVEAAGA